MNSTAAVMNSTATSKNSVFFSEKEITITVNKNNSTRINKNYFPDNDAKICCDVTVAQINYPSFKHNTQDSIEQARGRSHEEDSSQIFMLDDMQFRGGLDVI